MAKHFDDCPISIGKWDICTCDMSGEEECLVDWTIMKQEGKLKWYHIFARLMVASAPPIHRIEKTYVCSLDACININHNR